MATVLMLLAEGFEETEAITVIDLLRRAGIETVTLGVTGDGCVITGSHGIPVTADKPLAEIAGTRSHALVLPGGQPGTTHLKQDSRVRDLLIEFDREKKWVAAICAAPSVLAAAGLLNGRRATCYPGVEPEMTDATIIQAPVVRDGHCITSRGVGTAIAFGLEIIGCLKDDEAVQNVRHAILAEG